MAGRKRRPRRLTGLIEKNRSHLMAYLKRVTPIYGAYKTITLSVLAFILIAGCVLLYLNPGDHQLMMDLLLFLIVGPAVISPADGAGGVRCRTSEPVRADGPD